MKSNPLEIWFATGSQHLYGPQTLARVAADSTALAAGLGSKLPLPLVAQPVLTTPEEIRAIAGDLCTSKGTIQFAKNKPLSEEIVRAVMEIKVP